MNRPVVAVALAAIVVACQGGAGPERSAGDAPGVDVVRSAEDQTMQRQRTDPTELVDFSLVLRLPGAAERERLLAAIHDPASPDYARQLSAAEQGERFGLATDAIDRVVGWLRENGLEVTTRYQSRVALEVRGPASAAERLFGVRLFDQLDPDGRRYHTPDGEPQIPTAIGAEVAAVEGLDDQPVIRPFLRPPSGFVPDGGMRPPDVRRAFEMDGLFEAGVRGAKQTIAVVSFNTFDPADMAAFDRVTGTQSATVETVRLPWPADAKPAVSDMEVALDLQIIRGIAPDATLIDYEAPNGQGFGPVIRRIVDDGRAHIVSISWGACESRAFLGAEGAFETAALAGISIFVASGDDGAYDCWRNGATTAEPLRRDPRIDVDYPSSSPNVVSVGGTYLWVRTDGAYLDEASWQDTFSGAAGGGGLSEKFARPAWQRGPGVDNEHSNGRRQVPDVAGPADCQSAFFVVFTPSGGQQGAGPYGCGTSASAPFWAASMALARQLADPAGTGQVQPLGPVLYALAADDTDGTLFHDVTRGGNLGYPAGPRWDYATGWGSPRVGPLAAAIAAYVKANPTAP